MTKLKRGLCEAIAALTVGALASTVAAQPVPDDDQDQGAQSPGTPSDDAQGTAPADTPPDDPYSPPAGDAQHDPRPEASNAPAPGAPPPATDATTFSEGNTGTQTHRTRDDALVLSNMGFAISAGGGIDGFIDDSARNTTDDGGAWDVRAVLGTRSLLGVEISYIGSAQAIDALGLDDDALLIGNGVQGALRLNLAIDSPVTPFVYAGAAWRRYDLSADTNTSDIQDSDDVLELPLGAGVAFRYAGLILDARGEVRAATNEDLMPLANSTNGLDTASMHRWGLKANVGYEF